MGMFHTTTHGALVHIARPRPSAPVRLRLSTNTTLRHHSRKINSHHLTPPASRHHDNYPAGPGQHPRGDQPQPPPPVSTVNDDEISHFSRLSALWWDERGEFALLHKMNPHRIRFIREKVLEALQTQPNATTTATADTISSDPIQSLESLHV